MTRNLTLLALFGCTVLAGCGTENRSLESVHQPIVARTDFVYDMPAPSDRLAAGDSVRLGDWFDSLNLRFGDRVSVDTQGYGPAARDAVGRVAARYGLLIDEAAPVTQGDIPAGSVRVIVSRMSATVPNCPDWSRPATPNLDGHSMSNYGCATNSNLASMVADPRDLVSGRSGSNAVDATLSTKAIGTYRRAVPTGTGGLKSESSRGK
ncbi:MAG: CpaD family pilus assembly protein [Sphingomonadales bacterium]